MLANTMKKALVLCLGVAAYMYIVHTGHDIAQHELTRVQNLYTSANTQAQAIASTNR